MGKLYIHVGDIAGTPDGTEVIGSLIATNKEWSELGQALRAPEGANDRHVFSNSHDFVNGVRLAVARNHIMCDSIVLFFRGNGNVEERQFLADGTIDNYPNGLFYQLSFDLCELMKIKRERRLNKIDC